VAGRRTRGSVRRLPSGRWQVRYTAPDGQRRSAEHTYPTKADATKALSLIDTAIIRGSWVDPKRETSALGEYAQRWIQERPGLSPRTVELYSGLVRSHITPRLGGHPLHAITPGVVRSWRQHLLTAGVGPTTVAKAYRLLRAIMATAVDDELISKNPCRIKGASVEHTPERPVLTLQESFALADAIAPRYRALVLLAVFGSLRWGELMGLTRADVDLVQAMVHVRRSVAEVASKLVVKQPKSHAGVRSIALPQWMVPELQMHIENFAEPGAAGRLFVGVKGSTPRRGHWTKTWRAAKKRAGVPEAVHFHDLRHTGNHLAAASGASTRELMGRMGHASMRAALIYQHRTADRDRLIAVALDALIDAAQKARAESHDEEEDGNDVA
jgi:integrase